MNFTNRDDLAKYFKKAIHEESNDEIKHLKAEINKLKSEARDAFLKELKDEKDAILLAKFKDVSKDYQLELAKNQRALDLKVMEVRSELFNQLFNELVKKVKKYQATAAYETWLSAKINQLLPNTVDYLEINAVDKKWIKHFKVIENDQITAGFIVHLKDGKSLVDETFDTKIEDAKTWFYSNSKWTTE